MSREGGGGLRLDFRLAERDRDDAWLRAEATRVLPRVLDGLTRERIRAVVVAGSIARGEGAVLWKVAECVEVVCDLDLYVIARRPADVVALGMSRRALLPELRSGRWPVDVGVTTPETLSRLPATIANLSLVTEGRVVWGDADALAAARRVDPRDIPRADALNLVLNRAAEELDAIAAWRRAPADAGAARRAFVRGVKTAADLGLAVLMARGDFATPYRGRGRLVTDAMAVDATLRAAVPADFAGAVARACDWKRSPTWEALAEHLPAEDARTARGEVDAAAAPPPAARAALAERVAATRGVLAWYAGVAGARADAGAGAAGAPPDVVGALARSEPLARAARAWARYARRSPQAARAAAARLLAGRLRPSPRLGVQLAALALYLGAGASPHGTGAETQRRAAQFLPIAPAASGDDALERAVVATWGREIMGWGKA